MTDDLVGPSRSGRNPARHEHVREDVAHPRRGRDRGRAVVQCEEVDVRLHGLGRHQDRLPTTNPPLMDYLLLSS